MSLEQALADHDRVEYFKGNTAVILAAVREDGVDIRSYFAWSLLDNFEWYVPPCLHSPHSQAGRADAGQGGRVRHALRADLRRLRDAEALPEGLGEVRRAVVQGARRGRGDARRARRRSCGIGGPGTSPAPGM